MEPEKLLAPFPTENASSRLSSKIVWKSDPTGEELNFFKIGKWVARESEYKRPTWNDYVVAALRDVCFKILTRARARTVARRVFKRNLFREQQVRALVGFVSIPACVAV